MRFIWRADRVDVALGDLARVAALLDRGVLGRQAERVVAHRAQHREAAAPADVRDDVAQRVVEDVPHVQLARRVREHLEHVRLARVAPRAGSSGFGVTKALGLVPDLLPLALDCVRVVGVHFVPRDEKASRSRGRGKLARRRRARFPVT